jgi:hypothetical protein
MLTAFCVDYVVVSKLKLTVQKYQSINENRVFRLVKMILSKNLILPTTTFFQYGNTSKKKTGIFSMGFSKISADADFGGGVWHILPSGEHREWSPLVVRLWAQKKLV